MKEVNLYFIENSFCPGCRTGLVVSSPSGIRTNSEGWEFRFVKSLTDDEVLQVAYDYLTPVCQLTIEEYRSEGFRFPIHICRSDLHYFGISTIEKNGLIYYASKKLNSVIQGSRTVVSSIDAFREVVDDLGDECFYRGQSDSMWAFQSSLRRSFPRDRESGLKKLEAELLENFKKEALPFLENKPTFDLEWLTIGRHHGLPTRLLDWSRDPLIALYFAAESCLDRDGAVAFHFHPNGEIPVSIDPFSISQIELFVPPILSPRVLAQKSVFMVEPDDPQPVEGSGGIIINISFDAKRSILFDLEKLGIHAGTVWMSLDGVVEHVKSKVSRRGEC